MADVTGQSADPDQTPLGDPENPESTPNTGTAPGTQSTEQTVQYEVPYYVLDPEYAIGMGIISQTEYSTLRDEYYTQARTLTGIAFPLGGFVLYMWFGGQSWGWWPYIILFVIAGGVIAGLDRLHKFYSELQMLIIGHYVAIKLAEKKAADTAAHTVTKKVLDKELKAAFATQLDDIKEIVEAIVQPTEEDSGRSDLAAEARAEARRRITEALRKARKAAREAPAKEDEAAE